MSASLLEGGIQELAATLAVVATGDQREHDLMIWFVSDA